MFDGSELIGVLVIALVKDLTWVSAILLQGLHLHHCIAVKSVVGVGSSFAAETTLRKRIQLIALI